MIAKAKKKATGGRLKRRSVIRINTDQAAKVELVFVPGAGGAYIHFCAEDIQGYPRLSGFIEDRDIPKLKRFVDALSPSVANGEKK